MRDLDAFSQSEALSPLGPEAWARLAGVGSVVELAAGEQLFEAGDIGHAVYLVLQGHVAIYLSKPGQAELVLATSEAGDLLGEHHLFAAEQPARRSASARAVEHARLLSIPGPLFLECLRGHEPAYRKLQARAAERERGNLLQRSAMFDLLYRDRPFDPSQTVAFAAGEVVFQEGDPADAAYLVLSGRLTAYRAATPDTVLAELGVGDCFGERGILQNQVRFASVRALTNVLALRVARAEFSAMYAQSDAVRDIFAGLDFVYRLPNQGVSFNYVGRQGEHASVERLYHLADGRRFLSSWVPALKAFRLERLPAEAGTSAAAAPDTTFRWTDADQPDSLAQERVVRLSADGRIVAIVSVGAWAELPWLLERAIDGVPLDAGDFASFARTGRLERAPEEAAAVAADETACYCMQVKVGRLRELIAAGHDSFESLRQATGCGSVCGGCEPTIQALLGQAEWIPVRAEVEPQTDEIRSFRLRPELPAGIQWQTGQHVVVSGRIEGYWISRNYTITAAPGEGANLEIAVKREPMGKFSRWLFDGPIEEKELRIARPRGSAVWAPTAQPAVCLVAGIGVTPAVAIVRSALTHAGPLRVHVDYSGRTRDQMAFFDELSGYAARDPRITLHARQTSAGDRLDHQAIAALAQRFPGAAFFICGPIPYMDAVVEALRRCGVPPAAIREERFVHAGKPPGAAAAAVAAVGPTRRAGFIRRAYVAGLGIAAAILLTVQSRALDRFLPAGQPTPGHADLACAGCHAEAPGTLRQQAQAQARYWLGLRNHSATFGHAQVGNTQCLDCHARQRDNHATHLFLEARYATVRASLAPHLCVSCHTEHQGWRVTVPDGRFCSACHADMKLAHDELTPPASPTHAQMTASGRWDTCMACYDYHGNHLRRTPVEMSRAAPEDDVLAYFRGGPSPYGTELRSPARRPTALSTAAQVNR